MKTIHRDWIEEKVNAIEYNYFFIEKYLLNVDLNEYKVFILLDKHGFLTHISKDKIDGFSVFKDYSGLNAHFNSYNEDEKRKFLIEELLDELMFDISSIIELSSVREVSNGIVDIYYCKSSNDEALLAGKLGTYLRSEGFNLIDYNDNPSGHPFCETSQLSDVQRKHVEEMFDRFMSREY